MPDLSTHLARLRRKSSGSQDYLCIYETEEQVRALAPNMEKLAQVDRFAVIVTAPGKDCDFVSRFFAPSKGVPEDPVTGRAHCTLTPYWAERLGKNKLHARQLSKRGGELWCELRGDRVKIAGTRATVSGGLDRDRDQLPRCSHRRRVQIRSCRPLLNGPTYRCSSPASSTRYFPQWDRDGRRA
jgi:predicted PhzF superfamily epimerase YddE/YHI9